MGISGQPGPQIITSTIRLDTYYCVMEQAVYSLNCIPYLDIGNYGLLSPQHLINPWTNGRVRVREIPANSIQELREARGILLNQMEKLNTQVTEEIAIDVERWKQKKLKLGKNKSDERISVGDVVMLKRDTKNDMAQFGLILEISSHNKNALVRLVNGYCMNTGVGNLIPVTTEQLNRQELGE